MANLRKAKVDPHLFCRHQSALFGSPVYANYGRIIADERFERQASSCDWALRISDLVLETAQESEAPMPMASLFETISCQRWHSVRQTLTGPVSRRSPLACRSVVYGLTQGT